MKTKKSKTLLSVATLGSAVFLAACGTGGGDVGSTQTPGTVSATDTEVQASAIEERYTITVLTVSHSGELIATDHPAIRQLEELTGFNIELEMILNANFQEQMNLRLASGDLPGIVAVTGTTLPIAQAALGGAFWDLTDRLADWEYMADANPDVLRNIAINGRIFGMYRQRPVGRPGMVYRRDWLEQLGLNEPQTLEELQEVLVAFTNNNPEPNGGNTFGMAWTGGHMGPFHDLAVMHGAPNRWEVVNGVFVPWFEHSAFFEAMEFSRELFVAGAINQDFAALPTGEWALQFGNGLSGWHMDVADEARRSANRLRDNEFMTQEELDEGDLVWLMGTVANADGQRRIRAHSGHAGWVGISTVGAPDEASLERHLHFLNMLNSPQGQQILMRGGMGYNWEFEGDAIRLLTADELQPGMEVVEGLNQIQMRSHFEIPLYGVNSREHRITEVMLDNIQYAVFDPSLPFMSDTWAAQGASLNQVIDDAVINFVMGNIDATGFDAEVQRWYAEGGQNAINEFSELLAQTN